MKTYYHAHPNLSIEEAQQYAWLAGDMPLVEALDAVVDAEPLRAILDDHGIEDLEAFIREHERQDAELSDAEAENDDLKAQVLRLQDALRDAIKFMREPLPPEEVEEMAEDLAEALE